MSASFVKGVSEEYKKQLTEFLFRLFDKTSGIKRDMLSKYINENTIYKFAMAMTHESYDMKNNYEYLETLGDITLNKCVVWYFHRRFPELKTLPDANNRMSLIKNKNISKEQFADFARKIKSFQLIRYKETYTKDGKEKFVQMDNKLLTDTFEALMACIEEIVDEVENIMGVGVCIVYNILASLLDEMNLSIEVEDLMEPKTTILQMFSKRKKDTIKFEDAQSVEMVSTESGAKRKEYTFSSVLDISIYDEKTGRYNNFKIGPAIGKNKLEAQKKVSKLALDYLKKNFGITYQ